MKRIAFICLAIALLSGCSKEKIVSTSCTFDLKIDWVKGTKVQFTVTPGNPDACYCYGVMSADQPQAAWSDTELVEWQLGWITDIYNSLKGTGEAGSFTDMFCYKGPRTIKQTKLSSGVDFVLLVFQVNPQTKEAIGPLYRSVLYNPPGGERLHDHSLRPGAHVVLGFRDRREDPGRVQRRLLLLLQRPGSLRGV